MKRLALATLTLIFSSAALAQMPSLITQQISPEVVHSCVQSICGPAAGNYNAYNGLDSRRIESATFKNLWENDILSLINHQLSQDEKYIQAFSKPLAVTELSTLDQSVHNLLAGIDTVALAMSLIEKKNFLTPDATSFAFEIDQAKFNEALQGLTPEQGIAVKIIVEKLIVPVFSMALRGLFDDPLASRLRQLYPDLTQAEAFRKDAFLLLERYREIQKNYSPLVAMDLVALSSHYEELLNKAAQGEDLDNAETALYMYASQRIDIFYFPISALAGPTLAKLPVNLAEKLDQLRSSLAKEKPASTKNDDKTISMCRANLNLALAADASYLRRDKAQTLIKDVREAAKAIMPQLAAPANVEFVNNIVDQIKFVLPLKNELILKKFRDQIVTKNARLDRMVQIVEKNDQESGAQILVLKLIKDQMARLQVASLMNESLDSTCESIKPDTVTDHAISALGKISLSWMTLAYPEMGIGVIAHELGHIVSQALRMSSALGNQNEAFNQSLSCVANRNPFQVEVASLKNFEDTTWSEEDWADHFSSLVINEMQRRQPKLKSDAINLSCLTINQENSSYAKNTLEPNAGDGHSKGLLRLLMVAQDRGTMTPACQPLLEYASANNRALRCE